MIKPTLRTSNEAKDLVGKMRQEYRVETSDTDSDSPTDYDIAIHLAVQFQMQFDEINKLTELLDRYRRFTTSDTCQECFSRYARAFQDE